MVVVHIQLKNLSSMNDAVVEFSLGNRDETGNRCPQVQQGMKLDGRFGSVKPRPTKKTQTQIADSRIPSVNGLVQLGPTA